MDATYVEPGGSWRPFWAAAAVVAVLAVLGAVLPGPDLPALAWALAVVVVPATAGAGCLAVRWAWTVRVAGRGPDAVLTVGRERLPLARVDAGHLLAVRNGTAGVDAGAPVLGGGWSVPRGRSGLPLRSTDGRTALVPTRAPAELAAAILRAHPDRPVDAGHTDSPGRVEP